MSNERLALGMEILEKIAPFLVMLGVLIILIIIYRYNRPIAIVTRKIKKLKKNGVSKKNSNLMKLKKELNKLKRKQNKYDEKSDEIIFDLWLLDKIT